jgi:hypothetical protein
MPNAADRDVLSDLRSAAALRCAQMRQSFAETQRLLQTSRDAVADSFESIRRADLLLSAIGPPKFVASPEARAVVAASAARRVRRRIIESVSRSW